MNKVLVVIDMQTEFIKQCCAENIAERVAQKISLRKREGYEVVFTYDKSGGEIVAPVFKMSAGCRIYDKHSYGCAELICDLKAENPEIVEFVGVCTDICVITNALAAMTFLPFSTIVVDEKCCASANGGHRAAIKVMKGCKIKII